MTSLLILAVIIIGIVIIYIRSRNITIHRNGKISYSQRVLWIFSGYFAVLLICVVLAAVHPTKMIDGWKKVNIDDVEQESIDLYDAAAGGRIDQVDNKYIQKKWEFSLAGQQLNLSVKNNENQNTPILVERKKTNDGKLEAVFFRTASSVNGMEITDSPKPLRLELTKDRLTLINPEKSEIALTEFASPFTVNQFTGALSILGDDSRITHGQRILYLRIPKDLNLHDQADDNIQYVE